MLCLHRLMMDPRYIKFSAYWDDIFATGLLPFAALLFFNSRIYAKISKSRHHEYRFVGRQPSFNSAANNNTSVAGRSGVRNGVDASRRPSNNVRSTQQQQQQPQIHRFDIQV